MSLIDTILTLSLTSEGLYKEKGSRFISFAMPVHSENDVKEKLEFYKKKFYDARHICFAYILGKDGLIWKANDGNEPKHSAGDPILGQIRASKLTNVLVVVVRYFGGIKLGVGGLMFAYKSAAAEAINNNKIIEQIMKEQITINFPYEALNEVMRVIKDFELDIVHQNFGVDCVMLLLVREQLLDQVSAVFENMPGVQFSMNA